MAVATYATDLALIEDAEDVANYGHVNITGGGGAGLADETDYFIEGTQCISKTGFVTSTKAIMQDVGGTITIAAGDAVFVWAKQNNRNLMDTIAAGGLQVLIGDGLADFEQFYVDGNDSEGSDLAGWRNYAVDPTQTSSATFGTPTTTDYVGIAWKILGSGTLKGAPNGIDVARHGRELQIIDGQASAYGTFEGAAAADAASAWGILTPSLGNYLFHGNLVLGTASTSVDFRDSGRLINVLDDPFVPAGFNLITGISGSSNIEWTNIIIQHLGNAVPTILNIWRGTFTGSFCQFNDCAVTTLTGTQNSCTDSTWTRCYSIGANGANLSRSNILTPNISANTSSLIWDFNGDTDGSLDDITFTKTSGTAHHAIEFGTLIPTTNITLNGCAFGTDFSGSLDTTVGDETFHFLDTTGTITLNLVGCTGNKGYRSEGVVVTIVDDPVSTQYTVTDAETPPVVISGARVLLEASDGTGPLPFEEAVTITQTSGTATVAHTGHGIPDGTNAVIRGAVENGYNKVAVITVTGVNEYTYAVDSGTGSPATGSPVSSGVIIHDTTNGSGIVSDVRVLSGDQPFKGSIRDSSGSPFHVAASVVGIVSSTAGFSATASLQSDE